MTLLERVIELEPRAIVLAAPAGYGKSTFAREYARTFARAELCDCERLRNIEGLVRAIVDALAGESAELSVAVARLRLAQDAQARGELDLAVDLWSRPGRPDLFIFENADALRDIPGAHELLERLTVVAPAGRVLAFCSRRPLPVALSRAIGRHGILTIEADELRLDAGAVARLAAEYGVGEREAHEVARLGEGWPMVTRLLLDVAAAGRLERLVAGLDDVAFEELYDYLADAVLTALPGTVADALMVAAAIPGATVDDVRLALGERFDALVERRLLALPFVVRDERAGYAVHPLVSAMLGTRYPERMGDASERTLAAHEQRGDGARAAQIALAQGDARRAARLLDRLPTYLRTSTALADCEQVVSRLGPALIAQYPNLWIATIPFRRFAVELDTYLHEARTVYYCLPVDADPQLRLDAMLQLVNALYTVGELDESEALVREAFARLAEPSASRAQLLSYTASLRGLQGCYAEAAALRQAAAAIRPPDFFTDLALNYVDAHEAISRGRYEPGMAIIDESLRRMKEARLPLYIAIMATNGAIFAWANGDDARFAGYVAQIEEAMTPGIERGFAAMLAGARRRAFVPDPRFETPVAIALGHLYRMGYALDRGTAVEAARDAAYEADRCRDPYVQVLAHAACAQLISERRADAVRALLAAARRIESPELLAAAEAIAADRADCGILEPFVRRRVLGPRAASATGASVKVFAGRVEIDGREVRLSGKEFELLLYLAYARGTAARGAIVEAIWPQTDDEEDGINNLRVTLSRLRRKLGDERLVTRLEGGYRLSPEVAVDVRDAERLVRECSAAAALGEARRAALAAVFAQIEAGGFSARLERFAWFAPHRLRLRELVFAIGALLGRDALAHGAVDDALRYARTLVELDPLDEGARRFLVEGLVAGGERDAARRELAGYAVLLRDELDTEPSAELVALVELECGPHRAAQRRPRPLQTH